MLGLSLHYSWKRVNVTSSGGRFDSPIAVTDSRASAARPFLPVAFFGRNTLLGGQIAGSITLLVVLVFTHVPALTAVTPQKGGNETAFPSSFASSDCSGQTPAGYTRIFIAHRADGKSGAGTASDPFDGGSAQNFDALLRTRSESGMTNLVVCIGPGTFQTEGVHDYAIGVGHLDKTRASGFTVNHGWKVHGTAMDQTTLTLADLYLDTSTGTYLVGRIINTYDLDSYGVEISDLTLDDNYPALKLRYKKDLQLEAVCLRSNLGQHWIHNIHVVNAAGETTEAFPVEINSDANSPTESSGNIVEYVTMDHWASGKCTAIAIANAVAEVRFNRVIGHHIAYGGWQISDVHFHDNYAIDDVYGFNIDSLRNSDIVIRRNQIIHPQSYGLVIGGVGQFVDFSISGNTITLAGAYPWNTLYGVIFQGNVSGARVIGNRIVSDQSSSAARFFGLFEKGSQNTGNVFQGNQISSSFKFSLQGADCIHGNVDQSGTALGGLSNTQRTACLPGR
jgi:hypothetical protein